MRRDAATVLLLPIALAGLVGCDSDDAADQPSVSVADIRRIAETAGDSAKTCPLDLDLSEASTARAPRARSTRRGSTSPSRPPRSPRTTPCLRSSTTG